MYIDKELNTLNTNEKTYTKEDVEKIVKNVILETLTAEKLREEEALGFLLYDRGCEDVMILDGTAEDFALAMKQNKMDLVLMFSRSPAPGLCAYLRENEYKTIYYAPTRIFEYLYRFQNMKLIKSYCTRTEVKLLPMPLIGKDFFPIS